MKPSLANKNVIESYCTTGQFAKRDRTYHKHCGPTAITNLVLTLRPDLANAPAQVFDEVAALGRRLLAYWNIGAGKWLGGTSDGLAGLYLRQALNRFDCGNVKVRFGGPATEGRVRAALARGRLAWLEIGLPQRSTSSMLQTIPAVFHLLTNREIELPPFSVTSTLPSVMNGGKDFSEWSKKDDLLYKTLRKPVEMVLGRDGVGLADLAVAESKFEKGEDITPRLFHLMAHMSDIQHNGTPDIEFAVAGLLVRSQVAAGHAYDAADTLTTLREQFILRREERFLPNLDALRCRVDLRLRDDEAVEQWYREKAPRDRLHLQVMKRYQYVTLAMVALARGEAREALLTLAPMQTYCRVCSRHIDTIHLQVLSAIAQRRLQDDGWKQTLGAALDIALEYRFIRTITFYGVAVLPLLETCGWDKEEAFLHTLIDGARDQAAAYPDFLEPHLDMAAPLSATELQVLRLICADKSNAEIGTILGIRLATVKTHVSHILQKLGVKRRSEAKTMAEKLHLL